MKRILSVLLICCLLAALLSGCAGKPAAAPAQESAPTPEITVEETPAVTAEPVPVPVPERLELGFSLPAADGGDEELSSYYSPAGDFDCAFSYPAYCALWEEENAVRLDPGWFFARMFLYSIPKDASGAPEQLSGLLEPGKWGSVPSEITVGAGYPALWMSNLKYDTYRCWVAWETPERYYLLYGVCFDGMEDIVGAIFTTIADSFHTSADLLASAPENGTLLREDGALYLAFEGAELRSGEDGPCAEVRIKAVNRGRETCELFVSSVTADGAREVPIDARCALGGEKSLVWTFCVPLVYGEEAVRCTELSFSLFAREAESCEVITELPVVITIQ